MQSYTSSLSKIYKKSKNKNKIKIKYYYYFKIFYVRSFSLSCTTILYGGAHKRTKEYIYFFFHKYIFYLKLPFTNYVSSQQHRDGHS